MTTVTETTDGQCFVLTGYVYRVLFGSTIPVDPSIITYDPVTGIMTYNEDTEYQGLTITYISVLFANSKRIDTIDTF